MTNVLRDNIIIISFVLIMLFNPQTVTMATGGDLPPWDRNNPREQEVPIISDKGPPKHIYDVIIDKAPELIEKLDPSCLWPHLIRLQVIDNTKREEIEVSTDYLSKDLSETPPSRRTLGDTEKSFR